MAVAATYLWLRPVGPAARLLGWDLVWDLFGFLGEKPNFGSSSR